MGGTCSSDRKEDSGGRTRQDTILGKHPPSNETAETVYPAFLAHRREIMRKESGGVQVVKEGAMRRCRQTVVDPSLSLLQAWNIPSHLFHLWRMPGSHPSGRCTLSWSRSSSLRRVPASSPPRISTFWQPAPTPPVKPLSPHASPPTQSQIRHGRGGAPHRRAIRYRVLPQSA